MRTSLLAVALVGLLTPSIVYAQTFNSGSTGADGALDTATMPCNSEARGRVCHVQLPPDGVLNFTSVNVAGGDIVVFTRNLRNTPVYLLAQGPVTIEGTIDVNSHFERTPGPGGYHGGAWPYQSMGLPGFGPGAGPQPSGYPNGIWVGPLSLVPLIGGSGGRGGQCEAFSNVGQEGTGGGGAIAIASSTSVTITGRISAKSEGGFFNPGCGGNWGFGSGGAIRIVGSSVTVSGTLTAESGYQCGWGWCSSPNPSSAGVIRIEAPLGALAFNGGSTPAAVLSTIYPTIVSPAPPTLSILSVGGYPVPSYSGQRFDTVDLLLPTQLPDPIHVVAAASNIPIGTQVGISFGTGNVGTVVPGTLSGTLESSTTTVQVSGLNRTALAYLFVSATFSVPQSAANANPSGADHVERARVTAAPGAAPAVTFLRSDGTAIDPNRLPSEFLRQFQR